MCGEGKLRGRLGRVEGSLGGIVYILLVRGLTNIHMVVHGGRERTFSLDDIIPQSV